MLPFWLKAPRSPDRRACDRCCDADARSPKHEQTNSYLRRTEDLSNPKPKEETRDSCLPGEPICRRPVLPGPAPPRRSAAPPCIDTPVICLASNTPDLNVSSEARTSEMLCKPVGEQSPRLICVGSALDPRFNRGTKRFLRFWLLTSRPALISVNLSHVRHLRETRWTVDELLKYGLSAR